MKRPSDEPLISWRSLQNRNGSGEVGRFQHDLAPRRPHFRHLPFKDFATLLQHGNARAELLHFGQLVGRKQDRQAQFPMQPPNGLAHFGNAFRVQPIARLIEDQQLRAGQERLRQSQPRPHPVGVGPDLRLFAPGQPDPIHHLANPLRAWWARCSG